MLLTENVFQGQWTDGVKKVIEENNGKIMLIPNNMMHIFQPLDLREDRCCKAFLRKNTQEWYANELRNYMEKGMQTHEIKVDFGSSVLKTLHAS